MLNFMGGVVSNFPASDLSDCCKLGVTTFLRPAKIGILYVFNIEVAVGSQIFQLLLSDQGGVSPKKSSAILML